MKYSIIDNDTYIELYECSQGMSAAALWGEVVIFLGKDSSYQERQDYFLSVMHRLMTEGKLKLGLHGKFLKGTIEEQVQAYSDAWPKEEKDLADFDFQFIKIANEEVWDFWPPDAFVWIYEDGFEEWTM